MTSRGASQVQLFCEPLPFLLATGILVCGEPHCHCSCDPGSADADALSPLNNTKESEKHEASSLSALKELPLQKSTENSDSPEVFVSHVTERMHFTEQLF